MVNPNFLKTPEIPSYNVRGKQVAGVDKLCYMTDTVTDNGIWEEINPLDSKLPIFIFQLAIVLFVTRLCLLLLKPLRQPHFAAELLAGILVGSTAIASEFAREHIPAFGAIFAASRIMMMETVGNLGLIYHVFLLGLEMDLRALTSVGPKALGIGIAGAIFPFVIGASLYTFIADYPESFRWGFLYWGVALSVTGLPVIAEIFAKLKLLHSEIGRIAMSSALVNDLSSWFLLVVSLSITSSYSSTYLSLFSAIVFIIFSIFAIRPALLWVIRRRTRDGEEFSEAIVCAILAMVLACGLVTDICGVSSMLGAFVFGLIIPPDFLGHRFVLMLQGFASDLLLPLYYASLGMRTHLGGLNKEDVLMMVLVSFFSFIPKIVSTIAVSYLYRMSLREGFTLGVLMNTKGLVAVMAMSLGRDHTVMNEDGFAIMLFTIFFMSIATSPIVNFLYRRTKRFLPSQHRVLQDLKPDAELRILTCIHEVQTVAGITALLDISHASRRSPICVFALQLMQLKKHTTALLIVHGSSRTSSESVSKVGGQIDQLIAAFNNLEHQNPMVSVQLLTAISPYGTMHEDVCSLAEEKQVTLIILPFHKRQTIHNNMEEMNPAYKDVNNNILATAPCTVGILVDRGFGTLLPTKKDEGISRSCRIAMIFIGGPDDREALAYALRMARHPKVSLTVLRFILDESRAIAGSTQNDDADFSVIMGAEAEKQADDLLVNEFRHKVQNDGSIVYIEEMSSNGAETVKIIATLGQDFDLYVVGRGLGFFSPLKGGLDEWSDCPELGSIGDLLLTSDFSSSASIFVVQQHAWLNPGSSTQGNSIL
ncbi:cation/H(+) antiporter 15-like [Nicotiana sylvestris]|uniref:Cation/H(+) antiporter 15-like n=1 Tax=Nicotiana sylvestris TaxID=4096 RepID=A0A1U7W8H3_NICSY|nr:PREDICTED: cation/H(+) antiporter 15-like [Nicotiana sylvestris]XP_016442619.1 PREDICTED: cation/H(+) antiporter 15-like [Nicotiana tabacum]